MSELMGDSLFFGVVVSVLAYQAGLWIKRKWKLAVFNPLLISIFLVIAVLLIFDVDYEGGFHRTPYCEGVLCRRVR